MARVFETKKGGKAMVEKQADGRYAIVAVHTASILGFRSRTEAEQFIQKNLVENDQEETDPQTEGKIG